SGAAPPTRQTLVIACASAREPRLGRWDRDTSITEGVHVFSWQLPEAARQNPKRLKQHARFC
ncbi:hypothetical protein KIPB_008266, partial [Kipferlia bialata]